MSAVIYRTSKLPNHRETQRVTGRLFSVIFVAVVFVLSVSPILASDAPRTVPGRILVKPGNGVSEDKFAARLNSHGALKHRQLGFGDVRIMNVSPERTDEILASMRNDPNIEWAEPDYVVNVNLVPNDPHVINSDEWHLSTIGAYTAWDHTMGDASIIIAVLDSGANYNHPDLAGRLIPGFNFVAGTTNAADDQGHGTAVTGAIVAVANNGIGVAGVAPGCRVMPVKVVNESGQGSHSQIALGIQYAISHGARIINLSIGGEQPSSTLQAAIGYAWSNNAVVVAAAGNSGTSTPQYPAAYEHVLAGSATTANDTPTIFSTYGSFVKLSAPGENIWITTRDLENPYGPWSGTSLASPVAAGVAALVLSANPSLSNAQVAELLEQNADDLGPAGFDEHFGYGRVNAARAVAAAGTERPPDNPPVYPLVAISSPAPNGTYIVGKTIPLVAAASITTGSVAGVEFYANGNRIGGNTAPPYTFSWTPSGAGSVELKAVATSAAGFSKTSAPVNIQIASGPAVAQVTVNISGLGSVTPNLNGKLLLVGKPVALRAVPGPGQVLASWGGAIASTASTLGFVLQSNMTITAYFVPNPFLPVQGIYAGVIADTNAANYNTSGAFSFKVTRKGAFTGKLRMLGTAGAFRGQFDIAGNATVYVPRALRTPLTLSLKLDMTNGTDEVTGIISDGAWTSSVAGDRNVFSKLNPAPQAGLRNLALTKSLENGGALAASCAAKISVAGKVTLKGKMTDGRALTVASTLAKNGDLGCFATLPLGAEVLVGWINFPAAPSTAASGELLWLGPARGSGEALEVSIP